MNNEQVYIENDSIQTDNFNSLKYFLSRCLYHWPLFLLGVLITTGFAFYQVKTAKPVYLAKAKLLIKDQKTGDGSDALEKLNVTQGSKSLDNEIELIKSRPLIAKAVKDLKLWVTYQEIGKYYQKELYDISPVTFKSFAPEAAIGDQVFDIIVLADNRFVLLKSDGTSLNASFDNILKNSFGEWKLNTTATTANYIGKKIRITLTKPEQVAGNYQNTLNIEAPTLGSNILDLSVRDEVPARGKDFLKALIRDYIVSTIQTKNNATQKTLDFLNQRITSISGELNDAEKNVAGYKSSNGFTDIASQGGIYTNNVQTTDAKLGEINIQLDVLASIENYVNSARNTDNAPVTMGITDPTLGGLVAQLSTAIQQRNKLLATTPETNPIFDPINKNLRSIKEAIKESIQGVRSSLMITKRQLEANNSRFESSLKTVPTQERELIGKKRQQELKENLYLYLSQQRETIELNYASTLSDAQVVDEPHDAGAAPSKAPLILSAAFLLGLIIPAGFIYGRNAIKNQITDKREIESATNTPVIAEINYEENNSLDAILSRSGNILGEQIRELRTRLLYLHKKDVKGRVTLFTSSTSAEGKSFISSNLAVAIAASGRKTIILELDLRRPKVSQTFNLNSDHLGISDFLDGRVTDINAIVQSSAINKNLFILGAGTIPDNPSELLESFRMEQLIDHLKANFDDILLDSPPVHLVTDALILADYSDVTLYVVRQGYTSKEELDYIKRIAKERRLSKLNIVFNGVQNDKYGSGYHYDNSYYTKTSSKKTLKSGVKKFLDRF